jgi:hypothetical protein
MGLLLLLIIKYYLGWNSFAFPKQMMRDGCEKKKMQPKQGVYQHKCVALPFTLKSILKAKKNKLWKNTQIFRHAKKKYNLQKSL